MNLTPKQEFLKVYNHESIPAVPGMEIEFQLYREYAGEWPVVGEEMAKLSPKERELAHGHNAEIMTYKNRHDWILYHAYIRDKAKQGRVVMLDRIHWKKGWPYVEGNMPSNEAQAPKF